MGRLAKIAPPVASAVLLLLAFAPFNLSFLVFAGLVPWFGSLRDLDGKAASRSGYLFGFVFMAGQLSWVQPFVSHWTGSLWLGIVPWLLAGLLGAWYFCLLGWLLNLCWRLKAPWALPLVWVGLEVLRSFLPTFAFPWGLIASPLWPYPPIIQLAHLGAIYLVSAWIVVFNVMILFILDRTGYSFRPYMYVAGAGLVASLLLFTRADPPGHKSVLIGQTGVDMAFGNPETEPYENAARVREFYSIAQSNKVDLLVLPEGLTRAGNSIPPATPFAVQSSPPVIFGGQRGEKDFYQSAFGYDGTWKVADKTRLVIFGEYVPGRNWIPFLGAFNLPTGDMIPGEKTTAMDLGSMRVGPIVCFESVFPDVAFKQALHGSQLLAVISIDDWYMGTNAPDQLKASSVWRAVETGLPLVRSASLGYSMAVNGRGEIIAEAPLKQAYPLRVSVPVAEKPVIPVWLPVFPLACFLSLPGVVLAEWLRRRSTKA